MLTKLKKKSVLICLAAGAAILLLAFAIPRMMSYSAEQQAQEIFDRVQAKDSISQHGKEVSDSVYDYPDAVLISSIPLYTAKLTRDGSEQTIVFDTLSMGDSSYAYVINVVNADDQVIWTAEMFQAHAGWNTILLTRVDGKDYLMRYMPSMYQGLCDYDFTVFSLDADGNEMMLDEDSVSFGMNPPGGSGAFRKSDIEPVKTFFEHVNRYLAVSELLLSTDQTFLKNLSKDQYGKETGEKYAYGTNNEPIIGVLDYFYGSGDLTFDEQMKAFIKNYTEKYGEPEE